MAWGGEQIWIWQPLFGTCSLTGGSSGGTGGTPGDEGTDGSGAPAITEPPAGGSSSNMTAGNETFCDKASQAAEQVGEDRRGRGRWVRKGRRCCLAVDHAGHEGRHVRVREVLQAVVVLQACLGHACTSHQRHVSSKAGAIQVLRSPPSKHKVHPNRHPPSRSSATPARAATTPPARRPT